MFRLRDGSAILEENVKLLESRYIDDAATLCSVGSVNGTFLRYTFAV